MKGSADSLPEPRRPDPGEPETPSLRGRDSMRVGLLLGHSLVVVPLLVLSVMWTGFLLIIGAIWMLHAMGLD